MVSDLISNHEINIRRILLALKISKCFNRIELKLKLDLIVRYSCFMKMSHFIDQKYFLNTFKRRFVAIILNKLNSQKIKLLKENKIKFNVVFSR